MIYVNLADRPTDQVSYSEEEKSAIESIYIILLENIPNIFQCMYLHIIVSIEHF